MSLGEHRRADLSIPPNMRVPEQSVIARVHSEGGYLIAEENLSWWWSSSKGGPLGDEPILVAARYMTDHVQVLVTATSRRARSGRRR